MKKHKSEIIIFLLAIGLRIIAFFAILALSQFLDFSFPIIGSDSKHYLQGAEGIRTHLRYIYPTGIPINYFLPGYPLFLAALMSVSTNLYLVSFVQIILAGFSAVLLWHIGKTWSEKIGWIAALLFIFDPAGLFYSNVILSETLFIFLLLLFLWVLIKRIDGPTPQVILLGITFGLMVMVRPVAIALIPGVLLYFFLKKRWTMRAVYGSLMFLIGTGIIVGPWIVRNKIIFNSYEISQTLSSQLFYGHAPAFYAYQNNVSEQEAKQYLNKELNAISPYGTEPSDRNGPYARKVALGYLQKYPFQFAIFHAAKTAPLFLSDGLRDLAQRLNIVQGPLPNISGYMVRLDLKDLLSVLQKNKLVFALLLVGFVTWFIIICLSLKGAVAGRKDALVLTLVVFIAFTALLTGGAVSHPRYRHSISPFLFLLTSYGISHALDFARNKL